MKHHPENPLSTNHLQGRLKAHTLRSTRVTLAAQGVKLCLQLLSVAILARLLEPTDFGLIAMVTVFTGLATMFMDGGLSMATVQREQITHAQVSNLFWVNVGLGLGLGMLILALSPVISWVYDEPRLIKIALMLSLTFVLGGVSVQHDALLKRQMRFKAIAVVDIISTVSGIVVGVCLAWSGFGYWSLVVMTVATSLMQTALRWLLTGWRPAWIGRNAGTLSLLHFGVNLTGANFVGYLVNSQLSFLVGLIGGAQALGLCNRAQTLSSIPTNQVMPPIMNVMQTALARVAQQPQRFKQAVLSLMTKVALVTMLVTSLMVVMADWLVVVLLGQGWNEIVPIFRILTVASVATPITTLTAITLIAIGEAKALMKWRIITLCILVLASLIGCFWGVIGVILAYALSGLFIRMPLLFVYASRYLPISALEFWQTLFPSLFCATATTVALAGLRQAFEPTSPWSGLVLFALLGSVVYLAFCLAIRSARSELVDGLSLLRGMLAQK